MSYQTLVSSETLVNHLTNPNWIVIDCRFDLADTEAGHRLYQSGHIAGAHYAHLDEDLSGPVTEQSGRHPLPDPQALCDKLGAYGITPGSQVVAYDTAGGAIAARLWWLLRWLGHRDVAVLDGGWQAWLRRVYPQRQTVPVKVASRYPGTPDNSRWLAAKSVQDRLEHDEILLLDARAAERFAGQVEPIDPVAGHVAGAINRPFQLNLDAKGYFRPAGRLRTGFDELLMGRQPSDMVHMCGSGVTACHNLLAMEIAGLRGSLLYPGSWSEWIRDPARPVVKR